jgi:ribose 5-phosphate isomerase A
MITTDKKVDRPGIHAPVPVEVSPVGLKYTEGLLRELGAETSVRRLADGTPFLTDGMNAIVDCHFSGIGDPDDLDAKLHRTVGVFESGLFIGLCDTLIIGHDEGIRRAESNIREIPTIGG